MSPHPKAFVRINADRDFFTKRSMETRNHLQANPEFNYYPENWRYSSNWWNVGTILS